MSLGQCGRCGILLGEHRPCAVWPWQPQRWIKRMDAELPAGRVRGRAEIADSCRIGEGTEGVAEPLGDVQPGSRLVIEFDGVPLAECR